MPAILDAATPPPSRNNASVLARSARTRVALLALQATSFVLGVAITALMGNVLYTARDVEVEDPGYVLHRASSNVVVWDGVGGIVSATAVGWLVFGAGTRRDGGNDGRAVRLSVTGRETLNLPLLPLLSVLLLFAVARSVIATAVSFADFDRADALALAWDGDFDSRPAFFTPETYAANQGWGDGTSPGVAAQARAARICCAVLTVLSGVGLLVVLGAWRRERKEGAERQRVGSVAEGDEPKEVGGREVLELEQRERAELGEGGGKDGERHEVGGKEVHEMEAEVRAEMEARQLFEVEGNQAHEMPASETRRVYEMDASEPAWRSGVNNEGKWERYP